MQKFKKFSPKYRGGQNFVTDEVYRFKKDAKNKIGCQYRCVNFNCSGRLMTKLEITTIILTSINHSHETDLVYIDEEIFE